MQCVASSSVTAARPPVAARASCAAARWRVGGMAAHRRGDRTLSWLDARAGGAHRRRRVTTPMTRCSAGGPSEPSMKTRTKPSLEAPDTAPAAVSAAVAREYPEEGNNAQENGISAGALAALPMIGFAALIGLGVAYKDDITEFLNWFTGYVDSMGAAGPPAFMLLYLGLEILAVPAIPLTMAAGLIFGPAQGTAMVSVSATAAATASFLIARYALRDRVKAIADENPKFAAIDRAIGEDSFRVVCLLRLSPLLPFALSNYLYGLTSVKLWPYVAGSWLGMLPGTFAYVSAGAVGRTIAEVGGGSAGADSHLAQIAAGFGFTVLTGAYITRLASNALKDVEDDMNSI